MDYGGFKELLIQIGILGFSRGDTDLSNLPPVHAVQALFDLIKKNWAAKSKNNSTKLFDNPHVVALGDNKVLDLFNKKLAEDPDTPIPDDLKVVYDKEIKFEYKLPEFLPLPDSYKRSMEVLDDLFAEKLGLHIIEPVSKVVRTKRVVPKPKFDKKKMTGLAQKEDYKKAKKERLNKIKEGVIQEEKQNAEQWLKNPT